MDKEEPLGVGEPESNADMNPDMNKEMNNLRNLVIQGLEAKGVLSKLRA
jgi:hypothetical protein